MRLLRCDRVEYRRPSALARKLEEEPGRIYRHFLVSGLSLTMNGRKVPARDPLCLLDDSAWTGGRQFGDTLVYRIPAFAGKGKISDWSANCPSINGTTFRRKRKRRAGSRARRAYRWCAQAGKSTGAGSSWAGRDARITMTGGGARSASTRCLTNCSGSRTPSRRSRRAASCWTCSGRTWSPSRGRLTAGSAASSRWSRSVVPLGAAERQAGRADAALPPMPPRKDAIPEGAETGPGRRPAREGSPVPGHTRSS